MLRPLRPCSGTEAGRGRSLSQIHRDVKSYAILPREVVNTTHNPGDRTLPTASRTHARLRAERESRGLSQTDLAAICRVDPSTVSYWESFRMRPRPAAARRLV